LKIWKSVTLLTCGRCGTVSYVLMDGVVSYVLDTSKSLDSYVKYLARVTIEWMGMADLS